jgi:hypothetical protein
MSKTAHLHRTGPADALGWEVAVGCEHWKTCRYVTVISEMQRTRSNCS